MTGKAPVWTISPALNIESMDQERIRRFLDRIIEMDREILAEKWEARHFLHALPEKWQLSRIALSGECPVGFMIASRKPESLHVHRIAVDSEYRRMGIGAALLTSLAADAIERNISAVTLKVSRANAGAVRFYRNMGFTYEAGEGVNIRMSANPRALLGETC